MMVQEHLPIVAIAVPFAGASVAFLIGARRAAYVGVAVAAANAGVALLLVMRVLDKGPVKYDIGGWTAPLGITLVADGPSVVFIVLTALVGAAITAYATSYMHPTPEREGSGREHFWTLWLLLWASLNALLLTADVFNVYVCLELVGISAVALVTLAKGPSALRAGLRYMFASILGAMTYLLGVALLYSSAGSLDMATLSATLGEGLAPRTGLALMVAALVLKTALVPAHFWLPSAHSAAPTPVSAALSALVIKGSYFVLLRLFLDVMPPGYLPGAGTLLGALGAVAIVWGSLLAAVQRRMKLLVAYSTVAQIGYLFLVFPLVADGGAPLSIALIGVLMHVLAHGIAKCAMFLAAGGFLERFGTDALESLAGAARATPLLAFSFALAGLGMMGLPPSGGFAAKWFLVTAYLSSGMWWWAVIVLLGGLLAAVYVFRAVGIMIAEGEPRMAAVDAPARREWLPLALAAASAVLVLAVPLVTALLEAGSSLSVTGTGLP